MDTGTAVIALISALSLTISIHVWWRQQRAEGQAHFTAEWEAPDSIAYLNHGPGAAKDVKVRHDSGFQSAEQEIPYIAARQRMRIEVVRAVAAEPPRRFDVSWRDNRRGRQSVTIHLPDPPRRQHRVPPRDPVEKVLREMAREEAAREIEDDARWQRGNDGW